MGFMSPELPDVDPDTWSTRPRATRLQIVTRHWAEHGFGTPYAVYLLYLIKIDNTGDAREDLVIQVTFEGYESVRDPRCPANASGQGGQFVTLRGPARPQKVGAERGSFVAPA